MPLIAMTREMGSLGKDVAGAVAQALGKPVIDRTNKSVTVTMPNGTKRVARLLGSQGCVGLPVGKEAPYFAPTVVKSALPDAAATPWPMGDKDPGTPWPANVDRKKVDAAVEAAFDPAGMTGAFVVTYKGRIIGERYGPNVTKDTPLESWSMGKSLSATLLGTLMQRGVYTLDQPAPIPEWNEKPGDPRAKIRIRDILNMASGLRIIAPQDPDYDPKGPYPDHLYYYTSTDNAFHYAATRPQQWPPNTVGRYRNTDPVLTNYLVRLAVEKRKEDYHAYPTRALFDKIGVRHCVMEVDPYGNFLTQGYELCTGRDWARIANLYLRDGVSNGERLLPERDLAAKLQVSRPTLRDALAKLTTLGLVSTDAQGAAHVSELVGKSIRDPLALLIDNQEGTFHFHHLTTVGDGFLDVSRSLDEHTTQLAAALASGPARRNRAFVERFIRPFGLTEAATPRSRAGAIPSPPAIRPRSDRPITA